MINPTDIKHQLHKLTDLRAFVVAISAGMDSTVLLDLMAQLHPDVAVRAIHVNHGAQQQADAWQAHCQSLCDERGIALTIFSIAKPLKETGTGNFEARARACRYQALYDELKPNEVLLTAHHQQDQAETLLLQLFRGAGPMGMAAMPAVKKSKQGVLIRPLLTFSPDDIHAYAQANNLVWMDDSSNDNQHYQRNHIRHSVLPSLQQRWPAIVPSLARSADHCAEMSLLALELAAMDMAACEGAAVNVLSILALRALSEIRQKNLLRHWIKQQGVVLPGHARLHAVTRQLLTARQDRFPQVCWADVQLRVYRQQLYLLPLYPDIPAQWKQKWDGKAKLEIPFGVGALQFKDFMLTADWVDTASYEVRFRQGGEVFKPRGCQHHVKLKKWMQAQGISPWLRGRTPLLFHDGVLVGMAFT